MPAPQVQNFWEIDLAEHVVAVSWSRDRESLVAGTIDGSMAIVDVPRGRVRERWQAHKFGLASLEISPDGQRIVTCGQDGMVCIWNASDGALLAGYALPNSWGTRASYSPSGQFVAVAAGKHLIILSPDGTIVREMGEQPHSISDLAWTRFPLTGEETLAIATYGGVKLFRPGSWKAKSFEWKGSSLVLAWSPNGKYVATGDQDCTVHFWIARKGEDLMMSGYAIKVKQLSWSSDSRYLATGGGDMVTVWDCAGKGPAGSAPISLEGHENKIGAIAFRHAGYLLASGDDDGRVILWSLDDDATRSSIELGSAVSAMAWAYDDELLAIGTANGTVCCVSGDR